jgi:transposase InsO family protein
MSILKIKSIIRRKYVYHKKGERKPHHTFPNVIKRDFQTDRINHKWVTDITQINSTNGKEYLSCIKDLSDKSIIASKISNKNDVNLVMNTLEQAALNVGYKNLKGIILHSDQGHQYCSKQYHSFLSKAGMQGSMSNKGCPYDNAPIESFYSLLKNEELKHVKGRTVSQTRLIVNNYIRYYNYDRCQWHLKKQTPMEYRRLLYWSHF